MHDHSRTPDTKLIWSIVLNGITALVEIVGSYLTGSLSLASDALHNIGDSVSIVVSLSALKLSRRENNERRTYGYKRIEILAALFNGALIFGAALFMAVEIIKRLAHPSPVQGKLMMSVAFVGLVGNIVSVFLLKNDAQHNLNIRSSYLHLLSDSLSSVAVLIGGAVIIFFKWTPIDPILSVVIVAAVVWQAVRLLKEATNILMDSVPHWIRLPEIKIEVEQIPNIKNIHHVHVRQINDADVHLEAHVNLKANASVTECDNLRRDVEKILADKFRINHTTLQFEFQDCDESSLVKTR